MVDFTKKLKKKAVVKKIDPIEIYDSLDRRSETGPLRPSQKKILSEWFTSRQDANDNIIKLHTGEGKTLIGLLILQSKINSSKGPCLYICPNKYLADQVRQEAAKFGISTCNIDSHNDLPDDFYLGKKILVTHVQKLFNGLTIFGLNNKSIMAGAVILDDSHACIDSIKAALTIKVDRNHPLYTSLLNLFEDDIRNQGEGSYFEIESGEYNTMLPIPYWSWYDKKREVIEALVENKSSNEIKFVWPIIKDEIDSCQAFISGESLEISPSLMPIDCFGTFSRADHRIMMSATTQDDSFFIKGFGFDIETVSNPLSNLDVKWSGEKMILIPSLIDEKMDRNAIINWLAKPNDQLTFGVVVLAPGFSKNKQYEKIGANVVTSANIYSTVKALKDGYYRSPVVFANRYDGIDLPDKACRILIIDSKPYFNSLLDRYEEASRSNSDIINIKIAQKVEQGLGRSVRGEKDYSIIVLAGGDLVKFVKSPLTSRYFSAQTKKQIEIGIQIASFANEDSENEDPYEKLRKLMNQALLRDEGWKEYYSEEMENIEQVDDKSKIYKVLNKEYQAEKNFKIGEFEKACVAAQDLCDLFSSNIHEKGWYLQQLARFKYRLSKSESNSLQKVAFKCNTQLLKPKEGITYNKIEYINQNRVERIKQWILKFNNYSELILSVDGLLQDLSFGMPSEKFESALQELGEAIGFMSQRPDKEIKKGPDNLWCGVENQYFLLECKNEVDDNRQEISKSEAGQMNSHSAWFESVYGTANCKRILIIPTRKLSYHGDFTHNVEIMRKGKLKHLKNNIKDFYKEFHRFTLHEVGDAKIQELINLHKLDIENMMTSYSEKYYHATK
ncbi:DEAD/DEAH box helicase [Desulfoluna limicola]|uniref:DEAD/DEAH box helicase n=1 Tax=Desulfoluna limicola TaxID=2810562 RepID=A0ABM7PAS4_9BACT|nr:DEAD/DEAH box helicase family protein [Desulfoluna limicola]BCS94599.1 DEAD/DEAH box helicase [Desulfoluna limicola]